MNRRARWWHLLILAVIAFAIALVSTVTYWAVADYDGVRVGAVRGVTPEVPVGGTVRWVTEDTCNSGYDVVLVRWADRYEDGQVFVSYSLPTIVQHVDGSFCVDELPAVVVLPNYVKPGEYRLRTELVYQPNPLFTRSVEVVTEQFTVTP